MTDLNTLVLKLLSPDTIRSTYHLQLSKTNSANFDPICKKCISVADYLVAIYSTTFKLATFYAH